LRRDGHLGSNNVTFTELGSVLSSAAPICGHLNTELVNIVVLRTMHFIMTGGTEREIVSHRFASANR
jgi:hypothetical protein